MKNKIILYLVLSKSFNRWRPLIDHPIIIRTETNKEKNKKATSRAFNLSQLANNFCEIINGIKNKVGKRIRDSRIKVKRPILLLGESSVSNNSFICFFSMKLKKNKSN